jgi:hypothetical protein
MVGLLLLSPVAMLLLVFALERLERQLPTEQLFADSEPVPTRLD